MCSLLVPSTSTSAYACYLRSFWISRRGCRYHSFGPATSNDDVQDISRQRTKSPFKQLGVSQSITDALQQAYPEVLRPTQTQADFIPAILNGQDLLLKDTTGSGKSFGILLALLSKRRRHPVVTEIDGRQTLQPRITSLLMVPHRDLAYQYLHWAQRIHAHVQPRQDFLSFAQVIVRNAADPIAERLKSIRENPPALLIGTPQALMDALEQDEPALMLASLSTVVVDEADYLIESLPRGKDKYAFLKARRVLKRHPSPTRQLLDKIYLPYRPSFALQQTGDNRDVAPRGDRSSGSSRPQLVMASATLRAHFRDFVMREGGWFSTQRGKLIRVTGPDFGVKESMEDKAAHTLGGTSISHHALVVSKEGKVANIPGATLESDRFSPPSPDLETRPRSETASASDALYDAQAVPVGKMPAPGRPAPFRIQTLEAVAEAFALHVPRVALLVVQPSSPLVQIVEELRRLGVNADGLDVVHDGTGRAYMAHERPDGYTETPVLLVATLASMRGLDMPELTHVFMLGVPQDAPVDSYLHAAGRVGRFGRSGKVISILEERELVMQENGARAWKDDGKRMGRIYRAIGVPARKLAGFD